MLFSLLGGLFWFVINLDGLGEIFSIQEQRQEALMFWSIILGTFFVGATVDHHSSRPKSIVS